MITKQYAGYRRWTVAAVVLAVAVGAGCTASRPARVVEAQTAPKQARAPKPAQAETKAAAPQSSPAEIRSLDLREGAPEVFIDLEASAPLVWTSFRNAEGKVIVELPNAVPRASLADLSPADGLVSSLAIQRSDEGSRPMTRLVIATRQEVEHSVTADGAKLRIQLLPVGEQAKAKLAFEPLGEEASANPAPAASGKNGGAPASPPAASTPAPPAAVSSASPAAAGTPDKPAVAPAPQGVAATRLDVIEILAADGGAVIRIAGDGDFPYSTFALSEPRRFVIDLDGVINRAQHTVLAVNSAVVGRVRVAQFKPAPKPVSRIVFDLHRDTVPVIERTQGALVVSFPSPGAGSTDSSAGEAPVASPPPSPAAPAPAASAPPASTPAPVPAPEAPVHAVKPPAPPPAPPAPVRVKAAAPAAPPPAAPNPGAPEASDLVLAQRQPSPADATPKHSPDSPPKPSAAVIQSSSTSPGKVVLQPRAGSAGSLPAGSRVGSGPVEVAGAKPSPAGSVLQPKGANERERTYVGEPIDLKVT
ncbi:MAG TPA: AMIN domain-containing protein, partial [Thermoanaerobaculia bacterium]|nr:AMIN domain-containing protein [Thermoanaerobaculia bacterium]